MTFQCPDLDEVFAYKTNKVVLVKDRRLGILKLLFTLAFLLYFIVKCMIFDKAYFAREQVAGVIEMSLRAPRSGPANASELRYCNGGLGGSPEVLPCVTGPDAWVTPTVPNTDIFVTTRVKDHYEGQVPVTAFVQDIDSYTLGISFVAEAFAMHRLTNDPKFSIDINDVQTRLFNLDGEMPAGSMQRISRFDVIELRTFLRAAGILSLDTSVRSGQLGLESMRYNGVILMLLVDCPMDWNGRIATCNYRINHIKDSEAKAMLLGTADAHVVGSGRLVAQERRGVRIHAVFSGEVGRFDWVAVTISWVSALGMLNFASFVLDLLLTTVLPHRATYNAFKFEQTVDFSDFRDKMTHAVKAVEYVQSEQARRTGTHEKHVTRAVSFKDSLINTPPTADSVEMSFTETVIGSSEDRPEEATSVAARDALQSRQTFQRMLVEHRLLRKHLKGDNRRGDNRIVETRSETSTHQRPRAQTSCFPAHSCFPQSEAV